MTLSPPPLITIVTVCRNAAAVLEDTLRSVLSQDYTPLEYRLVDGASTDKTAAMLRHYAPRFAERGIDFRFSSEPDGGIYDAMNKGAADARGEWVCFMNAGDTFAAPDVLSRLFKSPPSEDCGVVYGKVVLRKDFGQVEIAPKPLATLAEKMPFCHQSALVRTVLLRNRPFDVRFRLAADYDFFRHLWQQGVGFDYRDMPVAVFEAETGVSSSQRLRVNRERALIRGVEHTAAWRINYLLKCLEEGVKTIARRLAPDTLLRHLRAANYRRMSRGRTAAAHTTPPDTLQSPQPTAHPQRKDSREPSENNGL